MLNRYTKGSYVQLSFSTRIPTILQGKEVEVLEDFFPCDTVSVKTNGRIFYVHKKDVVAVHDTLSESYKLPSEARTIVVDSKAWYKYMMTVKRVMIDGVYYTRGSNL